MPASFSTTSFTPDRLVVGGEIRTRSVTVATGQGVLARGTVLGKITTGGKYAKSASGSSDGSQTPDCILTEDVDATSADVVVPAYFTGDFNDAAIILGAGHTADSIREGLRTKGIHLITVQTTY